MRLRLQDYFIELVRQDCLPLDAGSQHALCACNRELRALLTPRVLALRTRKFGARVEDAFKFQNLRRLDLSQCFIVDDAALVTIASSMSALHSLGLGAWNVYVEDLHARTTSLHALRPARKITGTGIAALCTLTGLCSLNLHGCFDGRSACLEGIASLTALTTLDLSECKTTASDLAALGALTSLTSLNLRNVSDPEEEEAEDEAPYPRARCPGLLEIRHLTALTFLDLSYWGESLEDTELAALATLTSLRTLLLSNNYFITSRGLALLEPLTNLTSLSLKRCDEIDTFETLEAFTALSELDLSGLRNVDDMTLASLAHLTAITKLDLTRCSEISTAGLRLLEPHAASLTSLILYDCLDVSDVDIRALGSLTALTYLNVSTGLVRRAPGAEVFVLGFAWFYPHFHSLTSLHLSRRHITDDGLAAVARITSLKTLNISACKRISDQGLAHLAALTLLESMDMSQNRRPTDLSLAAFAPLTKLRSLNLNGCVHAATDVGLGRLTPFAAMKHLRLAHCTYLTDATLTMLRNYLPALELLDLTFCSL
eukprot:gene10429-12335_t